MEIPFNARIIITRQSNGIPDMNTLDEHSWETRGILEICKRLHIEVIYQFGIEYRFDVGELKSFEHPQAIFDLSRQLHSQTNFCNFVKLFEAYCAILNALEHVHEVRFVLL